MKYSKIIVALVILLNIIFAISVFAVICLGYNEPSTLIVAWYAFTGTELLSLATIRVSENKYHTDDSDEEPEDE